MTTGINNPMFVTTMRPAVAVTQYRAVNAARTAQCTVQDELIGGVAPMTIDAGTQGTIIEDGIVIRIDILGIFFRFQFDFPLTVGPQNDFKS